MKLKDSKLCLDCEEIFSMKRVNNYKCPKCGSGSHWSILKWAGRIKDTEVRMKEKEMIYNGTKKG